MNPRPGMFALVRNRRGVIAAVQPYDGPDGRLHLVQVEYNDDALPREDQLLWEREPFAQVLEPTALPNTSSTRPMPPDDFDAILRASRWSAAMPFLDPDGDGPLQAMPISAPFHGAVQVDDFQLVPLLKALRMPRVNLLIADDVGLGKTIEAGLILTELLLRRRIQRVLILTPASLRLQWRDEMWDKFALPFDVVDRAETHALRRRLGMDANPWRSFSRIIASYHYLRQDDVLEQFLSASRTPEGSAHLPWDLLIVDECHNLMPSPFGEDSDLCRTLRLIAPQFEHRLFLSATPHNGHTRSFTGLLEILDPVRFSQTDELKPAERERVQQVVLRRLKREINARTSPPRFCHRHSPVALPLNLSEAELRLSSAFAAFRTAIHRAIAVGGTGRRRAGSFAVEILGKRLLSCPTAFAESWRRCKLGLAEAEAVGDGDVIAAERQLERDTEDDREAQSREASAANVVGAWLVGTADMIRAEIAEIDAAVDGLGLNRSPDVVALEPVSDIRFEELLRLIERLLRTGGRWRDDERLIVFTEYKTTLDYLAWRLRDRYGNERVRLLFGGLDDGERTDVKNAFNNPDEDVRILLATDAAAEGLNLQLTARYMLHYDCPWNPSRLEQRNGRLDRHGQARDVTIHHFVSDQDQDLKFLAHVIAKADEIREDLGSVNELFDEAAHRKLVAGEALSTVQADLDRQILLAKGRAALDADDTVGTGAEGIAAATSLQALANEIGLNPKNMRDTLEAAMAIKRGRPQLTCSDAPRTCKVLDPALEGWAPVIDESLRRPLKGGLRGPVARLAFDPAPFMLQVGERAVFTPRPDVQLLHLSHSMMQRALSSLTRLRYPGTGEEVSRWTVRHGIVGDDLDAMVLLSVEELAVNDLRETFHHWVRTIAFPVQEGIVGEPILGIGPIEYSEAPISAAALERVRHTLDDVVLELKQSLASQAHDLTSRLREELATQGEIARRTEEERFRSRAGEVSTLIAETTLAKLEREIASLQRQRDQGLLFDETERLEDITRSITEKELEIARRKSHYEEVRAQLERERERILHQLLPRRYSMSGEAQVFPVTIEIVLPGALA
ncbi:MAG TPA: DISARM system SNF2-like helicase DrmD [Gemmatimonadales bacterium]|jgi:superfamily II DNA or RNA helicase